MDLRGLSLFIAPSVCACEPPVSSNTSGSETAASASDSASDSEAETRSESETETTDSSADQRPERLLMSADWRAKRLSLLDYGALLDSASRDAALWREVDLGDYEPGPLEAELTPDGSRALVAISPGFFGGALGNLVGAAELPDEGTLLVVDVEDQSVLAQLDTAHYPMGIALSADGREAWTANYGGAGQVGTTVSRVDLVELSISEEFELGARPEQLDLLGGRALVNLAGEGAVRSFELADPQATLSPLLPVSDDPSWVLFVAPDGSRGVSINSLGPPGYSLLDLSAPDNPSVLETIEIVGIPYAAAAGAAPGEIVMSSLAGTSVSVARYDTSSGELLAELSIPATGFPMGLVFDAEHDLALVPVPGADVLALADFGLDEVTLVDWQGPSAPTYVDLEGG